MGKKTTSLSSLGEPLFLGLSCIVGGEQFYILLYGTEVSIRAQSSVLVVTAIITCILTSAISFKADILANSFHLFYISVLILLMVMSNEVTSRGIVTVTTIGLGYALTVLVVQSCSLYSTSREELLSFILGLFSARYLPSFFRHFVDKSASHDAQIRSVSRALGISRLLFCIISLALKILMGRFQLSIPELYKLVEYKKQGFWERLWENIKDLFTKHLKQGLTDGDFPKHSLLEGFTQIYQHKKYMSDTKVFGQEQASNFYTRYLSQFFKFIPIVLFLKSVLIFLMYPRTRFSAYCSYSTKVLSTIMNIKMLSHIIGSLLGIGFPMSVTSNSPFFTLVTFFFYFLWAHYVFHKASSKYFEDYLIYIMVGCSSFVLGYMWSYNLGLVINMVLIETCIYEELETIDKDKIKWEKVTIKMKKSCCGEKITSECYCKLESLVKMISRSPYGRMFVCSKLVCEKNKTRIKYSKSGKCSVLLIYHTDDSKCSDQCGECTENNCNGNCCLKIIGKYKLESATISSCEDCQLTIRLEGNCSDPDKCPSCCDKGGECTCGDNGQCCCICVNCCKNCGSGNCCCCIHYCKKGTGCKCNCKDDKTKIKYVRVFICYKSEDQKCCIKEIRPNEKADFVGDLSMKNGFDIQDIFISECCHSDIKVDLRCAVKNNFFRLSGANYPRKFEKPDLLSLLWSESVCCPKAPATQCCCMFRSLVRGCLMFVGSSVECRNIKPCAIQCRCTTSPKCCVMPCDLPVDASGGFVKRVNRIRVKLVVIAWLVFGLVFFFVALIAAPINKKYSPRRFCPTTSYSKLAGTLVTNKYNSDEQVTNRLVSLLENGKISEHVMETKKHELGLMLTMFAKYTSSQQTKKPKTGISKWISRKPKPREVDKIRDHIVNKASRFTPSSGGRRFEQPLVEWSQCVGLVYNYAMPLFFVIQSFFVAWEEAWRIDLGNFRREIMPYFMKVTHKSRVSLSTVMGEANVGDKCNESGLNRLITWNKAFKEVKQFSLVTLKEDQVSEESIPLKIGNRLHYYVTRWNHRLTNIRAWCNFESNVFDWVNFLHEYERIRQWVSDVSPGLRCDSEVKVSTKDLNKGIQIFVTSK